MGKFLQLLLVCNEKMEAFKLVVSGFNLVCLILKAWFWITENAVEWDCSVDIEKK